MSPDLVALFTEREKARTEYVSSLTRNVANLSVEERIAQDIIREESFQRWWSADQKYRDAIKVQVRS